jgi:membrane protein DedA with SNARE-associated domain
MASLLHWVRDLPPVLIYAITALVVWSESGLILGLVMPGEATLLLVGFLTYERTLQPVPAVLLMIAAAVAGDAWAFRNGRRYGGRIRASRLGTWVGPARWDKSDEMLRRLGGRGVFGARWVAFVRTLMPRLAGGAGMSYRRFAPWNLAGVATWVGASVLAGYLAGSSYETVSGYLGQATGAVLALVVAVLAIVLVGRWLGRHPDPVKVLAGRAAALPPMRWLSQRYGVLFFLLSMHLGTGWALLLNLVVGIAGLFVIGFPMVWLISVVMHYSGLSKIDTMIATYFADRRADWATGAANATIHLLRGSWLIMVVAVVALLLGWRARAWKGDLVSVVGTVGAFLPLLVLALIVDVVQPNIGWASPPMMNTHFPTQNAVATASLCTLAWMLTRRSHWPVVVAAWTGAAVGVLTMSVARLYVGRSTASATVTSVLLGVLWTLVFIVAWATRDRAATEPVSTAPEVEPVSGRS